MKPSNPDPDRRSADSAGNGATKQNLKEDAREAKREVSATAREKAEAGQHRLADEADSLSDAIDAAASNLDDHDREGLARYARELSDNLANAAGQLEDRSVDELANDAKRLARSNPALFMLGSLAVGFGLSRFFKASAEREHGDERAHRSGALRNDGSLRSDVAPGTPAQRRKGDMTASDTTSSTTPHRGDGRDLL